MHTKKWGHARDRPGAKGESQAVIDGAEIDPEQLDAVLEALKDHSIPQDRTVAQQICRVAIKADDSQETLQTQLKSKIPGLVFPDDFVAKVRNLLRKRVH